MNSKRTSFLLSPFLTSMTLLLALAPSCTTLSDFSSEMGGGGGLRAPAALPPLAIRDTAQERAAVLNPEIEKLDVASRTAYHFASAQSLAKQEQYADSCLEYKNVMSIGTQLPEPVLKLAQVRLLEACSRAGIAIESPIDKPPRWLEEEFYRASLAKGLKSGDALLASNSLYQLSFFERTSSGRTKRLLDAMKALEGNSSSVVSPDTDGMRSRIQVRLQSVAPRFIQRPTPQDWLRVAHDFKQAREFDEARKYYGLIVADQKQSNEDKIKSLDGIRQTYKLQLRTDDHIAASKRWAQFAEKLVQPRKGSKAPSLANWKLYYETEVQYARAVWTDHRRDDAKKILMQAEMKVGKRVPTHDSRLIRARMEEEIGRFDEMAKILSTIDIDSIPDRATKAKVLWFRGWNLRRLKRFDEAIADLEKGNQYEDSPSAKTRNVYWIGRMQSQLGRVDASKETLRGLALENPFNIYGMFAARELEIPFEPLKLETSQRKHLPAGLTASVDWFVLLGELEAGRRFVESLPAEKVWGAAGEGKLDQREEALSLYSKVGLHSLVSQRLEELSPRDRTVLLTKRSDLMFPTPFLPVIKREAETQRIEPALVLSIIRQESQFEPTARSPADAFGLMQLIPEVAKKTGLRAGINIQAPEELFEPTKNIALGSAFLSNLFEKYQNRFILAVAAYNANDRAIQGWMQTRFREDPIEFLEEIPYDETRLYVKLVMRNFIAYKRRLTEAPFVFPSTLLTLRSE